MSENQNMKTRRRERHGFGPGGMGMPVEKPKDFNKTLKRLLHYLHPYLLRVIIVFAFAITSTVFMIWGPKVNGRAITSLMESVVAKGIVTGLSSSNSSNSATMTQKENQYNQQFQDITKAFGTDEAAFYKRLQAIMAAMPGASGMNMNKAFSMPAAPAHGAESSMKMSSSKSVSDSLKQGQDALAQQLAGMRQVLSKLPAALQKDEALNTSVEDAKKQADSFKSLAAEVQKMVDTYSLMSNLPKMSDAKTNLQKAAAYEAMVKRVQSLTPQQYSDLKQTISVMSGKSPAISGVGLDKFRTMSLYDLEYSYKALKDTGGTVDFHYIWQIMMQLLALYVLSASCTFVQQFLMASVSQRTVYQLRKDLNDKLARLPLKYFDNQTHGEILSRMTNDIDTISTTLQQSITQVITSIVQIVGYIIMMLTISPILTLIIMCTLPMYFGATIAIAKKSQKYFSAQQKQIGYLSGHVEEMYTGHKIVKAFGHEKESIEEFERINKELFRAGWKAQFVSGIMFPLMNFISNVGYVAIAVVGGMYVAKKKLELGDISAFIQYSRSFTQPIIQTANIANIIQSTIACAERVFEVLDEQEEIPDSPEATPLPAPQGAVRFENVRFGYSDDLILMEDMNIDVKPGQTIAIVGPTGAGKTTLVNLLMRFYEIQGGRITVDGVDIRNLRRSDLRSTFGMVLQDTWLFNGTIRENIAYGRENSTNEEIYAAARAAHADHFIRTLPEGYDTILNEEASNISQGQKQLLTIARAFLANPAVLILDEATSSVDTRTELLIQKGMTKLMKGRTNFVIAHRLSTIRDADLILVMNHGTIIETGTHNELLEQKGFYADLYNSQFAGPAAEDQAG